MSRPNTLPGLLKNPTFVMLGLGFAVLFFDLQYYAMSQLPGYRDEMCVIGAGLTPENIVFGIVTSLLAALFILGFYHTLKTRIISYGPLSFSSAGALLASLTVFCPACSFPVLTAFGFGFTLSLFNDYDLLIKLLSLVLLLFGLHRIDRQIRGGCKSCIN